eukprot:3906453-Pleurochrysis_carterae.AAC.1
MQEAQLADPGELFTVLSGRNIAVRAATKIHVNGYQVMRRKGLNANHEPAILAARNDNISIRHARTVARGSMI